MNLYLIRHGETAYNRDGLGLGRADIPLTPFGERQAGALGRRLAGVPFERVFVSPLRRAQQTAAAVAGERLPLETLDDLTEMHVGETEGLTFAAMRERFPEFLREWSGDDAASLPMPGGESLDDVAVRVIRALDTVRASGATSVAVVAHNFVLRVALCHILGLPPARFRVFGSDLASVSHLVFRAGHTGIRMINDRCHLGDIGAPGDGR